jgi:hypothetical protein
MPQPVYSITSVTLSSPSAKRYLILAQGQVPTGGWTNAGLAARTGVIDSDGNMDYDFLAEPPPKGAIVTQAFEAVSGSSYFDDDGNLQGLRQVRIFGQQGWTGAPFPPQSSS